MVLASTRNRFAIGAFAVVAAIAASLYVRTRTVGTPPPAAQGERSPRPADAVASRGAGTAPAAATTASRDTAVAADDLALRVRLVDADGKAPLPLYSVRLARSADEFSTGPVYATDDDGELALPTAHRGKPLTLVALDDAVTGLHEPQHVTVAANAWPARGDVLELAVLAGPTYTLAFAEPPPAGPLEATLVPGTEPFVPPAPVAARVRQGEQPWVRLDPWATHGARIGEGPWSLVVFSRSGWLAWGPVRAVRGVQPDVVLLRRVATGTLVVAPTIGGRPPDRAGLRATVQALDAAGEPSGPDHSLALDERSPRAAFTLLPAGRYRVVVGGIGDREHREDTAVRGGDTTTVVCDFPAVGAERPLQVVATSQTGTRELFSVAFVARKVGGDEVLFSRWVRDEPGRKIHQFDDLPAGQWDVEVKPTPHLPPWAASKQRVAAGAGTIEFVCLDANAPPPGYAAVRVLDAATGTPLAAAGATSFVDGRQHLTTNTDAAGVAVFGPYVAGKAFQVLAQAEGRAPQLVDLSPVADQAAPPRDVSLVAGWGTLLVVKRPEAGTDGVGVGGVEVLADGAVVGVTSAHGLLLLSLAGKPAKLELRHAQWVVDGGAIDPQSGAPVGNELTPYVVTMRAK